MRISKFISFIFALAILSSSTNLSAKCSQPSDEDVWAQLQAGNKRYVHNKEFARQRAKVANGQNPPCVVLSCSDSRVTPEYVFDQAIGRLFVARTAGQVVDDVVVDSIEFAVGEWDVFSIVVLGHTNCGAVVGALGRLRKNHGVIDQQNGHLNAVLIPIEKAIVQAGINIYGPNALEKSIRANIAYSANQLIEQSPAIAKAVEKGRVNIIGAEYSLKTGKVKQLFVIDSTTSSSS